MIKLSDHEGNLIDCELIHSNRKTLAIKIEPPGIVKILAPSKMSEEVIEGLLLPKLNWVKKKLEEMSAREFFNPHHTFSNEDCFFYLGQPYSLSLVKQPGREQVLLHQQSLILSLSEATCDQVRRVLEKWYKERAAFIISERVAHYQQYFSQQPNKIRIKSPQKRWGSCNSNRELNFNWKIIMAPMEAIDYVVVHELCHMLHMNHSKEYWSSVEQILPDWKVQKEWFRQHATMLSF